MPTKYTSYKILKNECIKRVSHENHQILEVAKKAIIDILEDGYQHLKLKDI